MCGIIGVAGDLWNREELITKRMLIFDWVRGPDSTGLAAVRNDGSIAIAKVADNPFILLDTQRFKNTLNANTSKVFIGHNRAATTGAINYANTHPFEVEHIVGCHNGTLGYTCFNDLKKELGTEFSCDSHAIMAAIAKWGLKDAIGRLEGSWSLVYYDSSDNTLNFIRNGDRPMTYAYSKDFKRLYWASESIIIEAACKLTGSELFEDKKGISFWSTEENFHYRFDVDALKTGSTAIPKPKTKIIKGKEKETVVTGTNSGNFPERDRAITRNQHGTQSKGSGTGTQSRRTGTSGNSTARYNGGRDGIHRCVGHPLSPFGSFMDRPEFEMFTYSGCSYCDEPVKFGDCGITIFQRGPTVLCATCSGLKPRRNRLVLEDRKEVPTV